VFGPPRTPARSSTRTRKVFAERLTVALGLVIAAGLWLPTMPALALGLTWTAPAACPPQHEVQRRIDALLGPTDAVPPSSASTSEGAPGSARANARVSEAGGSYQLTLTLSGPGLTGTRRLSGDDCSALADSAAFLIAVAVDPSLPGAAGPPAAETTTVSEPPLAAAAPPVVVSPAPAALPAATRVLWLHAAAFAGLWRALDPLQVQLGMTLGAGLDGAYQGLALRHQLELRGAYALPVTRVVAGPRGGGTLDTSSGSLELALCELWRTKLLFAGPCVSISGTRSRGEGTDFANTNRTSTLFWAGAALAVQVGLRTAGWPMPFLEAGAIAALTPRPSFRVAGSDDRVDVERVAFYGRLGVRFDGPLALRERPP
jgi:hypothetical protein